VPSSALQSQQELSKHRLATPAPCVRPHIVLIYVYSVVCSASDITSYLLTRSCIYLLDYLHLTYLSSKVTQTNLLKLTKKTDFSIQWHPKVIQGHASRVIGEPIRHFMSLHSNGGLSFKGSEDMATESTKNYKFPALYRRLRSPHRGTPANIRMNLTPPESSPWATFMLLAVWVYLLSDFCVELQNTHDWRIRVRNNRSRSFKVDDFRDNWKGLCDFLLVINSNIGSVSLTVSGIRRLIG